LGFPLASGQQEKAVTRIALIRLGTVLSAILVAAAALNGATRTQAECKGATATILVGLLRVGVLTSLAVVASFPAWSGARAQDGLRLGVDADPSRNTATALSTIEPCAAVHIGDTFDVDIFVSGVHDLLGWGAVPDLRHVGAAYRPARREDVPGRQRR
jgi:hypothetical protein